MCNVDTPSRNRWLINHRHLSPGNQQYSRMCDSQSYCVTIRGAAGLLQRSCDGGCAITHMYSYNRQCTRSYITVSAEQRTPSETAARIYLCRRQSGYVNAKKATRMYDEWHHTFTHSYSNLWRNTKGWYQLFQRRRSRGNMLLFDGLLQFIQVALIPSITNTNRDEDTSIHIDMYIHQSHAIYGSTLFAQMIINNRVILISTELQWSSVGLIFPPL